MKYKILNLVIYKFIFVNVCKGLDIGQNPS